MFIIGALVALGILIAVHEAGHLIAAKIFGVYVEKFSLGFGPRIAGFRLKETEYRISLIPLGGYVKMKGQEPDEEIQGSSDEFQSKTWWQRSIIAVSGPLANLVLAVFLFILSFAVGKVFEDHLPLVGHVSGKYSYFFQENDRIISVNGEPVDGWYGMVAQLDEDSPNTFKVERDEAVLEFMVPDFKVNDWYKDVLPQVPAVVGEVASGMPAYRSGLKKGDEILAVDGESVYNWYDMREKITASEHDNVELRIRRKADEFTVNVDLDKNILADGQSKMIGIMQYFQVSYRERFDTLQSIQYGVLTAVSFVYANYNALYRLLMNPSMFKDSIGGPVMMINMSRQTAGQGIDRVLGFVASISILLMIMNLLPIPVLDGGHIFFCFVEAVFRKKPSFKLQLILQQVGFVLLISLMVFAFYNDFSRIIQRNLTLRYQKNYIEEQR